MVYIRFTRRCLFAKLMSVGFLIGLYLFIKFYKFESSSNDMRRKISDLPIKEEKGLGCKIPKLDPFKGKVHPSHTKLVCKEHNWVECSFAQCRILPEISLELINVSCEFKDIVYISDELYYFDDEPTTITADGTYFLYKSDFVKVECSGVRSNRSVSNWTGYKAGLRPIPSKKTVVGRQTPDFMIICINSFFRDEFIRDMPKSFAVLKDWGADVFNGFHIAGGGAFGSLSPLLRGVSSEYRKKDKLYYGDNLEQSKLIFSALGEDGYRTAFYMDMPWRGPVFNQAFGQQPADHYICPFLRAYHSNLNSNGNMFCIGDTPHYNVMLNLTKQFFTLDGKKFSLIYISDISRHKLGYVSDVDEDVAKFLLWFQTSGKLDNTVIIVMSDHGVRFGPQHATEQSKLLFLSILLPKTISRKTRNFKSNTNVLTTPYDLHDTILDIIGLDYSRNNYTVPGSDIQRGISLLESIPTNRSCSEADISPYWCACNEWTAVSKFEPIYPRVVDGLVDHINKLTKRFPTLCDKRDLMYVQQVMRRVSKHKTLRDKSSYEYYQVKLIMSPNSDIFEAAVNYDTKNDGLTILEIDVTRMKTLNDESMCLNENYPQIQKYCFCRK